MGSLVFSRGEEIVGGAWLCREYGIALVQPLRHTSNIGSENVRREVNGRHENTYQRSYAPENTLTGHLAFMLKHERVHLELLSRLFAKAGQDELGEWMANEPTGQYSRRAAWFYEWLTGRRLDVAEMARGSYVNALDSEKYWTSPKALNDPRFRVRDNMPGTPALCPMVLLEREVRQAVAEADVSGSLAGLDSRFGADLLRRASVWLTVKESRSSFSIEGEADTSREDRFAAAMEIYLGRLGDLFGGDLEKLQREVLGPRSLYYGLRRSPIFVGQTVRFRDVVHYVAPAPEDVPEMMNGLSTMMVRTVGSDPLVRAAALSFAFVYVHPLCEGNGRVSRFVVNDVLRRDGIVAAPLVLPVSATIRKDMASYDRILDVFSLPFRRRYSDAWHFGKEERYPDGEISNFEFDGYRDALHAWRYLDLTDHVVYMARVVGDTLRNEMVQEAEFLQRHYRLRERLGEVIQASDNTLDRIIRSVSENRRITGVLKADYPMLEEPEMGERVLRAVLPEFERE
ncbi:Fic family protein [soil metagenome]